jgi:hypothetical protein
MSQGVVDAHGHHTLAAVWLRLVRNRTLRRSASGRSSTPPCRSAARSSTTSSWPSTPASHGPTATATWRSPEVELRPGEGSGDGGSRSAAANIAVSAANVPTCSLALQQKTPPERGFREVGGTGLAVAVVQVGALLTEAEREVVDSAPLAPPNFQVVHMATIRDVGGEIYVSSSNGNPLVYTFTSAGAPANRGFYYTVFGTNLAP